MASSNPCVISANNYFYLRGGSESVYFSEMQLLQDAGWRVVPFSMHHELNQQSEFSEHFVEEIEVGNAKSLIAKARLVPKSIYSFEARKKVRKLIELERPDICHLHNIYHHLSPSFLTEFKRAGVPVVLTMHDLKVICPAYNMLTHDGVCERCKDGNLSNVLKNKCISNSSLLSAVVFVEATLHRFLKSYINNVDVFIAPSRFYHDKVIEWGMPADKIRYLPNALDVSSMTPRTSVEDFFLYAGRLVEEKGVNLLIEAAAKSNSRIVIAGTGPLDQELKDQAQQLGVDAQFTGYLEQEELNKLIHSCRAMVLPSTWYENAPMSVIEAYGQGVPVIGADIGGIPELIEKGQTGDIFEAGNSDSLAKAMNAIRATADEEILHMGCQARKVALQRHNKQAHLEGLLDIYRSLGVSGDTVGAA